MTDALRFNNSLPRDLMELAILRVGRRYGAAYETFHHERLARAAGLSEAAVAAAEAGAAAPGLTTDEALVLALTDELLGSHTLSAENRGRAVDRFGYTQLADLVHTIGHYQQVCAFLNVFGVPVEGAAP
jgi:4-carboxymuconolactone decarboxylase